MGGFTSKGEQTRGRILETALDLFRERGYEETTMRLIAERAGIAVGNTYYYFPSKEHLVHAFYRRTHEEHLAACAPLLARERSLTGRLRAVLRARIDTSDPYHNVAGALFRTAADPTSPLNPFSPDSESLRNEVIALLDIVVRNSSTRIPRDLEGELPRLLWLYLMGVILFWIHDTSANRQRTYVLVDETVPVVVRLISLSNLPVLRGVRRRLLQLIHQLLPPASTVKRQFTTEGRRRSTETGG